LVPKLFAELALARADGRYARILRGLTGVQLLILDDWGLEPLDGGGRRDLHEILEERYGRRSTILTSQIPVDKCTPLSATRFLPTTASFTAHRIDLAGESLRRRRFHIDPKGLTTGPQLCQKSTASRAPASQATSFRNAGRHHLGISGRLRRNLHLWGPLQMNTP